MTMVAGRPLSLPRLPETKTVRPGGEQGVVGALFHRTLITVDLLGRQGPVGTGVLLGGVAHAGGAEFGADRLDGGPPLRGHPTGEFAHPVDALGADDDAAAACAVFVVEGAVGVDHRGQPQRQGAQVFRRGFGGRAGQVGFHFRAQFRVYPLGQALLAPNSRGLSRAMTR
ncbi:hypothetical protein MINS_25250 [Mycolicibacterium insubricum]|nr:hypothetical protein MINS_25250 [Mycolicibacterium insubricum]